jgi:hypothetical protein
MQPSQVLSIEIRPPDSKLLQPDIHADGAVPGGRLLSRLVCVVEGNEVKKDFAAMSGLAALGGFIMRQWMNYERRSLKYQKVRAELDNPVLSPVRIRKAFVIANVSCLKTTAEDGKRAHRSALARAA